MPRATARRSPAIASAASRRPARRAHHRGRRRPLRLLPRASAADLVLAKASLLEHCRAADLAALSRLRLSIDATALLAAWLDERDAATADAGAGPRRLKLAGQEKSRSGMHKPIRWPEGHAAASHAGTRRAVGSRASGAGGQVLLARRHRALHQPAEDLRRLRGLVPVRRRGPRLSRPADVVLGGQLRLPQPAPRRGGAAPARPAAAGGEPVSAPREDRARRADRPGCREEVRRRRAACTSTSAAARRSRTASSSCATSRRARA